MNIMKKKTNLNNFLFYNFNLLKDKLFKSKVFFSLGLYWIFCGFIFGNLFGTFLNFFQQYIPWDGFLIFCILFFFECFNFYIYKKKNIKLNFLILKNLNFFKIGLFFGFFVDAFKVGS